VTSAVIGVGGMAFLLFILMPSLGALDPEQRGLLAKRVMGPVSMDKLVGDFLITSFRGSIAFASITGKWPGASPGDF